MTVHNGCPVGPELLERGNDCLDVARPTDVVISCVTTNNQENTAP
jgi:hypothetical protein